MIQESTKVVFGTDSSPDLSLRNEVMECVARAYNEINPTRPATYYNDLLHVALHDKMDGDLIFGVVALKKGDWATSYHFVPGEEGKIEAKLAAGHRPVIIAALWGGNILSAETGYRLVDLDEADAIDPRIRERLKVLYAVRNGRAA